MVVNLTLYKQELYQLLLFLSHLIFHNYYIETHSWRTVKCSKKRKRKENKMEKKNVLWYETGTIRLDKTKTRKTNIVKTENEKTAFEAFDCGRDYLSRSYEKDGTIYIEEWDESTKIWKSPCQSCANSEGCSNKTADSGCSVYISEDEIQQLRKFKIEQERKRSAGLLLELPLAINTPVYKIIEKMTAPTIWEPALDTGSFSLADYFKVGKTVFPLEQKKEAEKALKEEKRRIKEHKCREMAGVDFEAAFRKAAKA